jgi:O-antigen/teichoic acid export membrane protein
MMEGGEGTPPTDRHTLDRSLVSGIAWTGGIKWVVQLFSWATTLVVARLLVPADFGIMGMGTLILGFIGLVNEFGLSAAIIQRKEIDEGLISYLGGFSLVSGIVLALLGAALAQPIAQFFHEPRVRLVAVALSLNFMISSPATISRSLLLRDMRFRTLATVDGANAVATSILTIVLAWMGWGYWALVAGALLTSCIATTALVILRPFRPRWPPHLSAISRELRFGLHIVGARIAWYGYSNGDFAVVGRVLGTAALGAYNVGWNLASLPVERISVLVMQVTEPVLARVQDRPVELRRYLKLLSEGISVVTFPIGVGMALVAPAFVPLVLGSRWSAAVVPLQLLALYGGFRSITPIYAQILVMTDHAPLSMWFNVLGVVFLIPAFIAGAHFGGTTGVALAWVIAYPALVVAYHVPTTFRMIGMRIPDYLGSLWPALSGCGAMALTVYCVQTLLGAWQTRWIGFGLSVLAGAGAYLGILLTLHRERVRAGVSFIRALRGEGRPDSFGSRGAREPAELG